MLRAASALLLLLSAGAASAADPQLFELAKKVANPIADLTTAPLQYNWDGQIGDARDGTSNYLRFEPVLPLHLDPDWNLITRLFMPMIEQNDVSTDSGTEYGLSGVNLSFFVSADRAGLEGPEHRLGSGRRLPGEQLRARLAEVGPRADCSDHLAAAGTVDRRRAHPPPLVGWRPRG